MIGFRLSESQAQVWEQRLGILDECLHILNQIQRKFVYLEPSFGRGKNKRSSVVMKSVVIRCSAKRTRSIS